jgi:hypothetical protein
MALSGKRCPDCDRIVRQPFEETITGRMVCPDCAKSLTFGSTFSVITGEPIEGLAVWAALKNRLKRSS